MDCLLNCLRRKNSHSRIHDSKEEFSHGEHTSKPFDPVRREVQEIERFRKVAEKFEGKSRKDRIDAYVDYYRRLKGEVRRSLNLEDEVESGAFQFTCEEIEKAEREALKRKNSIFHRYAIFSPEYHSRRENGERYLEYTIRCLNDFHDGLKKSEPNGDRKKWTPERLQVYKLLITGQYKEVIDRCTKVIDKDKDHAWARARRGAAYMGMKQYDDALTDFNLALKLDGDHTAWTRAHRGIMHRKMGQYEKARDDLSQALKLDSPPAWIKEELEETNKRIKIYNLGMNHLKVGRYEDARTSFTQVIDKDKDHAWARARRGAAYMGMRRFDDARADFNQALKLDGDHKAWTRAHRGIMHRKMGQYEKARDDLSQALKLDSPPAWIKEELEKLRPLMRDNRR
jgi:tetratricopeptide (TPR) repeat protein